MSKKPDESLEPFPALYHELVCSQIPGVRGSWYQKSEGQVCACSPGVMRTALQTVPCSKLQGNCDHVRWQATFL